jgi:pyruvate dehydrogenase phosphatase
VARALAGKAGVKGQLKPHRDGDQLMDAMDGSQGWEENAQLIEESLKSSFNELDKNISDEAMNCLKLIEKGRSIKEEGMLPIIMRAVAGACALVTMVTDATFYVASTGDCRAVLGTSQDGEWLATPLSVDQNVRNQDEVDRIKSNHPGEENTVIVGGRLLGMLMPFRSFGDVECKWPANMTKMINNLLLNYETPPYLTAEPVVTHWTHQSTNKFLILSTDGMWDKLTNEQAVNTVGKIVQDHTSHQSTKSSVFSFFTQRRNDLSCCLKQNAATGLLWEALGGDPSAVQDMLDIPPSIRRSFRDDMTIIVVHFK